MRYFFNLLWLVVFFVYSTNISGQEDIPLLTLGDSAPKFDPDEFVRGEPFNIEAGTVYVLEFSGTQCAPCIKAIPLMERLQNEHSDVVFAAVFNETKKEVLEFLSGHGKQMSGTVVSDPDQSLKDNWCEAAGFVGIPHIVVVDKAGNIAWMGYPDGLEFNLKEIVANRHSYIVDAHQQTIRYVEFLTQQARKQQYLREKEAEDLNNKIVTQLFSEKQYSEIVKVCDQAIHKYHDLPIKKAFQARKLLALGFVPETQKQSYEMAKQLVIEDSLANDIRFHCCKFLTNHYQHALPENKDERMMRLVIAYLAITENKSRNETELASVYWSRARVHFVLNEREAACEQQQKAIRIYTEMLNEAQLGTPSHDSISTTIETLNSQLSEYQPDAE